MSKTFNGYNETQLKQSRQFREDTGLTYPDDKEFDKAWDMYQEHLKQEAEQNSDTRMEAELTRYSGLLQKASETPFTGLLPHNISEPDIIREYKGEDK